MTPAPAFTMSKTSAKKASIVVPILAVALTVVGNPTNPDLIARTIAGALILMILLALLAEVAPALAGGIAAVVGVTALLVVGEPAYKRLSSLVSTPKKTARVGGVIR